MSPSHIALCFFYILFYLFYSRFHHAHITHYTAALRSVSTVLRVVFDEVYLKCCFVAISLLLSFHFSPKYSAVGGRFGSYHFQIILQCVNAIISYSGA